MVAERRPYVSEQDVALKLRNAVQELKFRTPSTQALYASGRVRTHHASLETQRRLNQGVSYPGNYFVLKEDLPDVRRATKNRSAINRALNPNNLSKNRMNIHLPTGTDYSDWEFVVDASPDVPGTWEILARYNPKS